MPSVETPKKGDGEGSKENGEPEIMEIEVEPPRPPPKVLTSGRTTDDVDEILSTAKLDKAELQKISHEIIFDSNFSRTEYRLLQLDKAIVGRIETGEVLVFRGDEADSAVLCTDTETFEIKDAETSNSLLLFKDIHIPDIKSSLGSGSSSTSKSPVGSANNSLNSSGLNDSVIQDDLEVEDDTHLKMTPCMILDVAHSYLEMKKMNPNLSKIRFLLRGSSYDEDIAATNSNSGDVITLDTLLERVAASKQEILDYLETARVVEIEGQLMLVDDDYLFRVLSQIINCVDENSWSPTEIDKDVVIQTLSSLVKPFFVEKVFQWFMMPVLNDSGPGPSTSATKFTYQRNKVCAFLGQVLLKTMGKFNLTEFLKLWQESVPDGLEVDLSQLRGIAVYDEEESPAAIWHFPEYNLPEIFSERLALLFETKRRWKLDDIFPYLEVFATGSQSVGVLLTKYARSSTVNGVKFYSSKHGR